MPSDPSRPPLKAPIGPDDHVQGPAGAEVELVEYGDFQCPHCSKAAAVVNDLRTELGDRMRFAFRHFPLGKIHPLARKAAEAAEAAAAQGKFWEMHDALFAAAPAIDGPDLPRIAGGLGLDVARFDAEMAACTYADRVQADVSAGARSGVNGTPTFFVNGLRLSGGYARNGLRIAVINALGGPDASG